MAASAPYIPASDAGTEAWAVNFDSIVAVDYASLGVSAPEAAAITAATGTYVVALLAATDPGTRTAVTIAAKNVAKASLLATVRPIAQRIAIDPTIGDMEKVDLGLNPHTAGPSPITAPGTFPVLGILRATPGQMMLKYVDSATPDTKAKPYGVIHMETWRSIGTVVAPTPVGALYYGPITKSPTAIDFDSGDAGKIATIFGRWVNANGLTGPWSSGVAMTIAF